MFIQSYNAQLNFHYYNFVHIFVIQLQFWLDCSIISVTLKWKDKTMLIELNCLNLHNHKNIFNIIILIEPLSRNIVAVDSN